MGKPPWQAYVCLIYAMSKSSMCIAHHDLKSSVKSRENFIIILIISLRVLSLTLFLLLLLFLVLFALSNLTPIPTLIPIAIPIFVPVLVLVQGLILVLMLCTGEQAAGGEWKTAVRAGSSAC